ncbi:hypothetical protein VTK26DRAFT_3190 [Humicola hyalothermophila]
MGLAHGDVGLPNMTASHDLLPATIEVEASYAKLKRNLDELQRQFKLRELEERAALEDKLKDLDAEVETQRVALVTAQSDPCLRTTVEKLLRESRDLKAEALRKAFEEQRVERKKLYDEAKKRYRDEAFQAVTALAMKNALPGSISSTPPRTRSEPETMSRTSQYAFAVDRTSQGRVIPAPSPQPKEVVSIVPTQATSDRESQVSVSASTVPDVGHRAAEESFQNGVEHSQVAPAESFRRISIDEQTISAVSSTVQSPMPPCSTPGLAAGQATPLSESMVSMEGIEQSPAAPGPVTDSEPVLKRKATNVEPNPESPSPVQIRAKRTKLDKSTADDLANQGPPKRTITFSEVYGKPAKLDADGKPIPTAKHIIVQYPPNSGKFYILKCDEHGVHFGEHPLRGAAKHLASAQHGNMCKAHVTAIATLGHLVLDCTQEMADLNNAEVLEAFRNGYKPFNANNLSQTKRAELGYPPLETPSSQKAGAQRSGALEASPSASFGKFRTQPSGVAYPTSARFYVAVGSRGEAKYPVLILPLGDMSPAGIHGTLAETGIFNAYSDGRKQPGVPDLPKCYDYEMVDGRITGIKGWATGYGAGGPLVRKREFPVLCVDSPDYHSWTLGWIEASNLAELDFNDPNSRKIPFFREARDYYITSILEYENKKAREASISRTTGTAFTPRHDASGLIGENRSTHGAEDVEMRDAGPTDVVDMERDLNRGKPARTKLPSAPTRPPVSPATQAQMIAAQALGLQPAARTSFTPINAHPPLSRSASASQEPPSRSGSVSSTSASHKRVVKIHAIHAASKYPPQADQTQAAPAIVLPERPAESNPPPPKPAGQPSTRRLSPASLQNILQDPSEALETDRRKSQSPRLPALRGLSSIGTQGADCPKPSLSPDPEKLRENRAGSAPVQRRSSLEGEKQRVYTPQPGLFTTNNKAVTEAPTDGRAGSAPAQQAELARGEEEGVGSLSGNPIPIRQDTPQSVAPEPTEKQTQTPQPVAVPPRNAVSLPPISHLNGTPLTTPTTSSLNARAKSPVLIAPKPVVAAFNPVNNSFASRLETLSLTPTPTPPISSSSATPVSQAATTLPNMDAFDLGGFVEDDKELFASENGNHLRLVDDHVTGVFQTADDAMVKVVVEPRKIRVLERTPVQNGAVCVVRLIYHREGGEEEAKERTQTLVFEKARSTASGMLNGVVHARRFCRRVQAWNEDVVVPAPGPSVDSINWRPDSQKTPAAPASAEAAVAPVTMAASSATATS